ncbi:hypothetical protein [Arthrobacter sp.]|uniref:hypothetical protein n=1 Tax=Arthrobacter sp. TaxID=1667 RepID=UPI003A8E9EBC
MNKTPRITNRIVLTLLGLILTGLGVHGLLLAAVPAYAQGWRGFADQIGTGFTDLLAATTLEGQRDSWLWIVISVVMIALILLMIWWVAVQGQGKTGIFVREFREETTRGIVELSAAVPEQAFKAALAGRPDLVTVSVTSWTSPHSAAGLRIKVQPRLGAAPYRIAEDLAELVVDMDGILGAGGPVVIHLATGARTRMSRAERVR